MHCCDFLYITRHYGRIIPDIAAANITMLHFNVCIEGLRQICTMPAPKMAGKRSARDAVLQHMLY
jgi:hypothetical protein